MSDLLKGMTHSIRPQGVRIFRRKTGPETDQRHSSLEKAIPVTGPREAHATSMWWERALEAAPRHPKATPGPDELINHNHYLRQCQSTCSCHRTLVTARSDESQDVEHAKNINLRVEKILIGFRPPGVGSGARFPSDLSSQQSGPQPSKLKL